MVCVKLCMDTKLISNLNTQTHAFYNDNLLSTIFYYRHDIAVAKVVAVVASHSHISSIQHGEKTSLI